MCFGKYRIAWLDSFKVRFTFISCEEVSVLNLPLYLEVLWSWVSVRWIVVVNILIWVFGSISWAWRACCAWGGIPCHMYLRWYHRHFFFIDFMVDLLVIVRLILHNVFYSHVCCSSTVFFFLWGDISSCQGEVKSLISRRCWTSFRLLRHFMRSYSNEIGLSIFSNRCLGKTRLVTILQARINDLGSLDLTGSSPSWNKKSRETWWIQ